MLVWEGQEYYVTHEPAKAEEVGQRLGEVTKKIEISKKSTKTVNRTHYKKNRSIHNDRRRKGPHSPLIIKEPDGEEYRIVRPMLKVL